MNNGDRFNEIAPRCPARDGTDRCVRDEDHPGEHVASNGKEWLAALLCRVGAREPLGPAVCARIVDHEGACVPRYGVNAPPATEEEDRILVSGARPPMAGEGVPPPLTRRKIRGVCQCGVRRQEHGGTNHTGKSEAAGCRGYWP